MSSDSDTEMIFSGQSFAYTLVHGDFHGSNVLVTRADTTDGGSLTTNGGVGGTSSKVCRVGGVDHHVGDCHSRHQHQ